MTLFAIAGTQMEIGQQDNIAAMEERLEVTMSLYPWVQMVLFSELVPYGTNRKFAEARPGSAVPVHRPSSGGRSPPVTKFHRNA